jgi:RNA polymerase sigma factor (sigma-70 family)
MEDRRMGIVIDGMVVAPDFDLTPELDAAIDRLARRAKDDIAARNQLYEVFALKLERFARGTARRMSLRSSEFSDVQQEAFIVFCEMIRRWKGSSGFAGYVFAWFPTMLSQAVARLERGHPDGVLPLDEVDATADPDLLLSLVDHRLSVTEREFLVLELRVTAGLRLKEIATLLGCHPRTVRRIIQRARQRLVATGEGSGKPRHAGVALERASSGRW